ncbi:hypothetical protein [Chryseoglobus sp. 28M-23]|uniref:hypothetical protein n=1 Tax=Chryseoglobus sp. 28M-23 TaxID=2772253 RepID=UPI001747B6F3|nr:hypothetical protein [Chryseoglobus sp. 28M-23]QOD93851.1 hypothetical protein IE160_01000 [Chryseoglobus sp. 28M-23]
MNPPSTRIWTFATIIAVIAIVALGWFLGAAPKLAEMARYDSERAAVLAQNQLSRTTLAQLEADFERLEDFQQQLAELQAQFPELPEYADAVELFLRELVGEGLPLESIVINEPVPADPTLVPDQFGQVPPGTLVQLDVVATVGGELPPTLAYIDALQRAGRFTVVPSFTFSAGSDPEARSTTITIILYMIAGEPAPGVLPLDGTTPEEPTEDAEEAPAEGDA